jgi:hypothetical protein
MPDDLFVGITLLPHKSIRTLEVFVVSPDWDASAVKALQPLRKFIRPLSDTIKQQEYIGL